MRPGSETGRADTVCPTSLTYKPTERLYQLYTNSYQNQG